MASEPESKTSRRRERLEGLSPTKRALLLKALQKEAMLAGGSEPIGKRPDRQTAPLSFAQERLLFIEQLFPGTPAYNIPAAVRLEGPLQVAALQQSFQQEVNRHEALRTTFRFVNGEPTQQISEAVAAPLPVIDLSDLPKAVRESVGTAVAVREAQQPFDLERGPLVRLSLVRLSENDHIALLTMHHIISDGWSIDLFIGELVTLYEALTMEKSAPLPNLAIQYGDYAYWQTERSQANLIAAQLDYWKQQLQGVTSLPKLVTDRPRPAMQTFHGSQHRLSFNPELLDQVEALSRQAGTTTFIVLLAILKILLHSIADHSDMVVGTPVNNRQRVELEGVIGLFVNTLVLRTDLSGNPTFEQILARVRAVVLAAHAHQDIPFETVVKALQVERDMGQTPLFGVWFLYQVAPAPRPLSNLKVTGFPVDHGITHYDLRLNLLESVQGLNGTIEYNTDLFLPSTIFRLANRFEAFLRFCVNRPELTLAEVTRAVLEEEKARKVNQENEQRQANLSRLQNVTRRAIAVTDI
ncbi:MAG TPA: condensation domain-containing protein [Pyrinomonadaceae bacterium]